MTSNTLQAKTVFITGCSSGIGYATAKGLTAHGGYRVIASARKSADVTRLQQEGLECLLLDLSSSESIQSAVAELLDKTQGKVYGLFNNAGFGQPGAVEDLSRDTLRFQFETNLFGTHELTCALLPAMRAQGEGRIIHNSSLLGYVGLKYRGAYNASKFALEGLTDTLRLELADTNIFVSLIEPGPITSRFRQNAYANYLANIDREHSAHKETYLKLEKRLTKEGAAAPFTLPPEAVLHKVIHALESEHPKARYPVTLPAHVFWVLKRILPTRTLDWLCQKIE